MPSKSKPLWPLVALLSLVASAGLAQQPPSAPPEEPEKTGILPRLNLYLPEGRADLRVVRPIRNSLFESQINYNFVSGDLSAFLRYKYYGRTGTSTFSFFDSIEFSELEQFSNDFSRTRGALYLYRFPLDYYNRLYGLVEFDRLTFSNRVQEPDDNRTNVYLKVGYQFGTLSDDRSNAVVGEARDRVLNLFTAHREIGPKGRGLSVGATWGFDWLGGDYTYVKTEFEALQALPIRQKNRLILRLHGGYFPYKKRVRPIGGPPEQTAFSVPRYELFFLDGREELKGYRGSERGPNQLRLTGEFAVPVFTERTLRFLGFDWKSLYAIFYAGAGNVGSKGSVYTDFSEYKLDSGVGMEAALSYRNYRGFLGLLVAKTLVNGVRGPRVLLSLKTYR